MFSLLILCFFTTTVANANTITVYGSDDPTAYTLTSPGLFTVYGSNTPTEYTFTGPGYPSSTSPVQANPAAGPWASGAWMAPQSDQSWPMDANSGNLPGIYNYTTTFNIAAGLNPSTATLSGTWATDNSGVLYLNGNQVGTSTGDNPTTNFNITSGFTSGTNTLTFAVTNDPYGSNPYINPTGLLVNISQATATTEPTTPVEVTQPAGPWASGTWMAPQSDQSWPMDANSGNLPGIYDYTTTFNIAAGLNPSTATLSGTWATDNSGVLYLNGNQVGTSTGYNPTNFNITSGFKSGTNTLTFAVYNSPYGPDPGINPTGLLVNFNRASVVPEPTTFLLLGLGIAGVALYRRKMVK
jgi:hypothetical protein